jgi:ABC-type cobalamin/Fe3+-siderophores transport system ATPase subunit
MAGIGVLILGENGTGKSTSIRNLDPNTTGIINVSGKRLPFKNSSVFKTLMTGSNQKIIETLLRCKANKIIIDDWQHTIVNEFMAQIEEKGYNKFSKMAYNYWSVIKALDQTADDKIVYFMSHIDRDQFGNERAKTFGRLLEEKVTPEGYFAIVLKTVVQNRNYYFSTHNSGSDTVKSPLDMFKDDLIPNDLKVVDETIRDYYGIN